MAELFSNLALGFGVAFTPINLLYATSLTHAEAILSAASWVP